MSILVIGDIFLDRYLHCKYRKQNPEADGSVYNIEREQFYPGGAAAVAMMCRSLGVKTTLCSVTGVSSGILLNLLDQTSVEKCIIEDYYFTSAVKTRYIVDNTLYPDRFDYESIRDISVTMADHYTRMMNGYDVILICDYGKGVITQYLLDNIPKSKLVLVDPAIGRSWGDYSCATIIKSNELEAIAALQETSTISHISDYARTLADIYDRSVVVTRGEIGIQYACHNQSATTRQHESGFITARLADKRDICGAGDTVFATLGVYLSRGSSLRESCEYAVQYAAQQVQCFGVRPLTFIQDNKHVTI